MKEERLAILREIHRAMEHHPEGSGLHVSDLTRTLGEIGKLDLYYLDDSGLIYRKSGYLKLSAAGMDIVEQGD